MSTRAGLWILCGLFYGAVSTYIASTLGVCMNDELEKIMKEAVVAA
jgi:hypothetical protein